MNTTQLSRSNHKQILACLAIIGTFLFAPLTTSLAAMVKNDKFKVYGDFRTRLESDWDSQKAGGEKRKNRTRLRIRARAGFEYYPNEYFTYGLRIRTGAEDSHQSPHITVLDFNDNDTGDADFNFDKWFLKGKIAGLSAWVGKNSLPFWKQNEMFWDDDVTPAGLGGDYTLKFGNNKKLVFNLGYFSLPVGMRNYSGNMGSSQVAYHHTGDKFGFDVSGGLLKMDANPNDPNSGALQNGNGVRDYSIWVTSFQGKFKVAGKIMKLGADLINNVKSYSSADSNSYTAANYDQTAGYVFMFKWGSKSKGNWLLGYYYAHIEALSVNSSYAQDDWVRWGTSIETRGNNMKGHEFRFAYGLADGMNIVTRLYLTEAITTQEDGKRLRIDLNYKF